MVYLREYGMYFRVLSFGNLRLLFYVNVKVASGVVFFDSKWNEMAVVLDNGGFAAKIGYSTDEEPRCLLNF